MKKEEVKSEFGKGTSYCLGLFLAHDSVQVYGNDYGLWFNGAADHFYELVVPENYPDDLKKRLNKIQSKGLGWRLPIGEKERPTKEDKYWAIQEAKNLLLDIDKYHNVEAIEAEYS